MNGQSCTAGTDCYSGICADGVCCGAACTGTCYSCNLSGSAGTCTTVTPGQPDDSCLSTQVCTTTQICKLANGQTCSNASQCYSGNCLGGTCQP